MATAQPRPRPHREVSTKTALGTGLRTRCDGPRNLHAIAAVAVVIAPGCRRLARWSLGRKRAQLVLEAGDDRRVSPGVAVPCLLRRSGDARGRGRRIKARRRHGVGVDPGGMTAIERQPMRRDQVRFDRIVHGRLSGREPRRFGVKERSSRGPPGSRRDELRARAFAAGHLRSESGASRPRLGRRRGRVRPARRCRVSRRRLPNSSS